jgi:hypothetical protein
MSASESWTAWRKAQVEQDDRDMDAQDAFQAGYEAGGSQYESHPWHQSLMTVLIVAVIAASVCYVLAGTPH